MKAFPGKRINIVYSRKIDVQIWQKAEAYYMHFLFKKLNN